uniref:Secreted protein n=1 Tax=Trichobilharzia regenti TaxID=157069 RepID=A0AA85INY7_TRIRE|nr:unnamed protein product [Trichobilharzia regenti]
MWIISVLLLAYLLLRPVTPSSLRFGREADSKFKDLWEKWMGTLSKFFQVTCTLQKLWDLFGGKFLATSSNM